MIDERRTTRKRKRERRRSKKFETGEMAQEEEANPAAKCWKELCKRTLS
jgi:hypothetical protein